MLRPVLLVKIGLGGLVFAARWGQNGAPESGDDTPVEEPALEEPGDFLRRHLENELSGQFAQSWDDLHPVHQRVVSRDRYAQCRAERFERTGPPTELESFDVLEVTDESIAVAGLPEQISKAVTAHIAMGVNGNSRSGVETLHALHVDGRWAWVFPASVYRAYATGSSPVAAD